MYKMFFVIKIYIHNRVTIHESGKYITKTKLMFMTERFFTKKE